MPIGDNKHQTKKLNDIDIDCKIYKLIKLIWESDIETVNSCENNVPDGFIWIEFSTYIDFYRFMDIVTNDCNVEDLKRMMNDRNYNYENAWIFDMVFHDYEMDGKIIHTGKK